MNNPSSMFDGETVTSDIYAFAHNMAKRLLPDKVHQSAVDVLKSLMVETLQDNTTNVCRVSPGVARFFPGVTDTQSVHYLACGASRHNELGYIIRPVPDVPEDISDPEDWTEIMVMWELVGFLEGFPTAPIKRTQSMEIQ